MESCQYEELVASTQKYEIRNGTILDDTTTSIGNLQFHTLVVMILVKKFSTFS